MNDGDNSQLSLGNIIASLPAIRAAKKINTMSVYRRLIEVESSLSSFVKG